MKKKLYTQKIFILFFALVLFPYLSYSQVATVVELEEEILKLRNSSDTESKAESDNLMSLVYDTKPTLYCTNKQYIQTGNQEPIRIISDVSTLSLLYKANSTFQNIELICLKMEKPDDLNTVLKVSELTRFPKLKYLYFLFTFEICAMHQNKICELEKITKLIPENSNYGIKILYTSTSNE